MIERFTSCNPEAFVPVHGKVLRSVSYWLPPSFLPDFDSQQLNKSGGCQFLELQLDSLFARFTWIDAYRHGDNAPVTYYQLGMEIGDSPWPDPVDTDDASYVCVDATATGLWRPHIGRPLDRAVLWGDGDYPQAARLAFDNGGIFIAIGWVGDTETVVGDGDDVLVFTDAEWAEVNACAKYKASGY